ncbi:hypothetical protein BU24DRAFT_110997 [Aaosphaeria arxii CBS 175.79]|uniref:Uncharacterized protein n=1 Tax=Aaosphaeria arxii CBS 175.79 TaxID=1450172 RepID=A0A6A5Y2B7_9PLEO|nr:uncharacterized protein BU24DRAFT_110997 [Aaosphaeria arxii CBS 175.79]KAF2019031.1 hypothetical protein BU24DRAFT_110997 [Aaosphaeria arxii CBS 175.79]
MNSVVLSVTSLCMFSVSIGWFWYLSRRPFPLIFMNIRFRRIYLILINVMIV